MKSARYDRSADGVVIISAENRISMPSLNPDRRRLHSLCTNAFCKRYGSITSSYK